MRPFHRLVVAALCLSLTVACVADDAGKACTGVTAPPSSPLVGTPPAPTQIVVSRDTACLNLQCLTAGGLQPYCSRACRLTHDGGRACQLDADCPRQQQCAAGRCAGDDCPAGFWCRVLQDAGPYAGQPFCIRRPCSSSADCGDAAVACTAIGCYGGCASQGNCPTPQRVCAELSQLNCRCPNDAASCDDSQLQCQPRGAAAPLAPAAVQRAQLCQPPGDAL